jgi:hypothetical protein
MKEESETKGLGSEEVGHSNSRASQGSFFPQGGQPQRRPLIGPGPGPTVARRGDQVMMRSHSSPVF